MSEIKTALERFKAYCASKGIPEKSSLAHIHKIGQFEEHERKELRAAYEALQKENNSLKLGYKAKEFLLQEAQKEVAKLRSFDADNKGLKECNAILTDENAALQKENADLKDDLQFVERWANHHGTKPNVTAQEALSCIQHYPSIAAITKSYKDGVIPTTRNPYAEIESLNAENLLLKEELRQYKTSYRQAKPRSFK